MPSEKPLDRFLATVVRPTMSEHLVDPAARDAVALGQAQQMVVGAAAAVHAPWRPAARRCAAAGSCSSPVVLAVDADAAGGRVVQVEHHAHGGGLAGAVGAEEAGDDARAAPVKVRWSTAALSP